jgi:tetratricopeptide (TPR) repeat protein
MMEGLDMWRRLGDPHSISLGLNHLGPTLVQMGQHAKARAFLEESVALCAQTGNRWGIGTAYRYLGLAYLGQGMVPEAQAMLRKSLETFRGYVIGWDIAKSMVYLGEVDYCLGDCPEAERVYLEALHIAHEVRAVPLALDALAGLATIWASAGQCELAAQISHYIVDHPNAAFQTSTRARQILAEMEALLPASRFAAAQASARDLTIPGIEDILRGKYGLLSGESQAP